MESFEIRNCLFFKYLTPEKLESLNKFIFN
jgi:hypothetical protein